MISTYISYTLIQCAVLILPLMLASAIRRNLVPLQYALVFFLLFQFEILMLYLPKMVTMNEESRFAIKAISILFPWIMVYGFKWFKPKETGLLSTDSKGLLQGVAVGLALGVTAMIFYSFIGQLPPESKKGFLYQLTMPGFEEEVWNRGIYFALITRAIPGGFFLGRLQIAWRLVLITLMYMAQHLILWSPENTEIIFAKHLFAAVPYAFLCGVSFCLLRRDTGSIWPPIVAHTLSNTLPLIFPLIILSA